MIKYSNIFGKSILLTVILISFFGNKAVPQQQTHSEEVTIIGLYKPSISKAYKININPKISGEDIKMPVLTYGINPKKMNTKIQLEPIKPAKISGDRQSKLYRNSVKAGFGNYITPYFEFFANSLRSKDLSFGVHLKHISSNGDIKNYANSAFSNNEASVYGKKFFRNHTFSANIFYKRNVVHFYGYKPEDFPDTTFSKDDIKQRFQIAGTNLKIQSNYLDSKKLNHLFELDYYYLADFYETNEQNIYFKTRLDKNFKLFNLTENQNLGLIADINYYNNTDSLKTNNSTVVRFLPFISTDFNQYKFYLGLNASIELDSTTKLFFYPIAKAEVVVVPKNLIAYVGVKGELNKNSFKILSDKNPFIISTIPLEYSNNKFEVFGGLNGNLFETLDFNVCLSNSLIDNMPFFVNDTSNILNNTFNVVFDDISLLKVKAEISYQKKERIKLNFGAAFNKYTMDKELKPWHKPDFEISFGANYNISNKFIIKAEIFAYSKIFARTFYNNTEISEEIKGWIDLNLGFEYRINKMFSVFVNFNNIGNLQYQKWYNYPVQQFNFIAGITYSF